MNEKQTYFQDALSDFTYDAACGRAIRHLADTGFTTAQIMQRLDYPTSFAKVRHTATRYFMETGILLDELPVSCACLSTVFFPAADETQLYRALSAHLQENGETHSFVSCPFGTTTGLLSILTAREREYIDGIEWMPKTMYHRLNRRMLEIGVQLAMHTDTIRFYFIKSRKVIAVPQKA